MLPPSRAGHSRHDPVASRHTEQSRTDNTNKNQHASAGKKKSLLPGQTTVGQVVLKTSGRLMISLYSDEQSLLAYAFNPDTTKYPLTPVPDKEGYFPGLSVRQVISQRTMKEAAYTRKKCWSPAS